MKTSKYKALIATPLALAAVAGASLLGISPALADVTPSINLGQATGFSVLGGSSVGNTGAATLLQKSLGVAPGSTITGFPPGQVQGATEANTPIASKAHTDAQAAYSAIAGSSATSVSSELGGQTFAPGAYKVGTDATINGVVTLNGNGTYIFQVPNKLAAANAASIVMTNGATSCDVYWQIGDTVSVGNTASMVGSFLASKSIDFGAGTKLEGRLLSDSGAVTLNNNVITAPNCTGFPIIAANPNAPGVNNTPPPATNTIPPVDQGVTNSDNSQVKSNGASVGMGGAPLSQAPSSGGAAGSGGGSPANASGSSSSASATPSALAGEQLAQTGEETAPLLYAILGVVFGGIVLLAVSFWRGRNKPQEN